MKYFVFTLDDGVTFDKDVIAFFKEQGIKATFNLNSGLQDYVWYKNGVEIKRNNFINEPHIYDGFEVSSHTLTHPNLIECPDDEIIRQVEGDIKYLRWLFKRDDISSFAVPFSDFNEHIIDLIKNHTSATNIRVDEIDESFKIPTDQYHIKPTAYDLNRAKELLPKFIKNRKKSSVFIFAGHSYDFFTDYTFDEFKEFVMMVKKTGVIFITMKELENLIKNGLD